MSVREIYQHLRITLSDQTIQFLVDLVDIAIDLKPDALRIGFVEEFGRAHIFESTKYQKLVDDATRRMDKL